MHRILARLIILTGFVDRSSCIGCQKSRDDDGEDDEKRRYHRIPLHAALYATTTM